MKGDYHRYMAEFKVGDEPKEAAEDTMNSYKAAQVREGRMPGKTTELENLEANIAEVLLMVQVSSAGFDGVVNDKLEKMARAFAVGAYSNSPPLPLTSLLVQDHKGISNVAPADAPLRSLSIPKVESETGQQEANDVGEATIHDYISNLQFCMSPTAFFQVNTLAAEKSYSLAGDWAGLGPDTLLFDICCGIGTIGLTLAHRVGTAEDVTGSLLKEYLNLPQKQDEIPNSYDTNDEEVTATDATDPEESSGVEPKNSEGASECSRNGGQESHVQQSCTSENGTNIKFKNVVAIVDPPRVDFIPLYISCNPESLVANAIELCTPSVDKTEKGNKNNRGWRNMSSAGNASGEVN